MMQHVVQCMSHLFRRGTGASQSEDHRPACVRPVDHRVKLGSVTERVLPVATCSVMTVPPHARSTSRLPFRRLPCPVDSSDSSVAVHGRC